MNYKNLKLLGFIFLLNVLAIISLKLRKYQTEFLSIYYLSFFGAIFILFFSSCVLLYNHPVDAIVKEFRNKITPIRFGSFVLSGILGVTTWLMWIHLVKTKDMSKFIPVKQGMYIALTFLVGLYFYDERPTLNKIVGLLFIFTGIFIIGGGNKYNPKIKN